MAVSDRAYSGARLRLWQALLVPMGVMVATDLVLWSAKDFDARYSPWDPTRFLAPRRIEVGLTLRTEKPR